MARATRVVNFQLTIIGIKINLAPPPSLVSTELWQRAAPIYLFSRQKPLPLVDGVRLSFTRKRACERATLPDFLPRGLHITTYKQEDRGQMHGEESKMPTQQLYQLENNNKKKTPEQLQSSDRCGDSIQVTRPKQDLWALLEGQKTLEAQEAQ